MFILFVDESGTPPKPGDQKSRYFVLSGLIVPEGSWARLRDALNGLKIRRKLRGEIKWRYFAPGNDDAKNPLRNLAQDARNEVRDEILKMLGGSASLRVIAVIVSASAAYELQSVSGQEDIYHLAYKVLSERFQYFLQDQEKVTGRTEYGIIVCDHRGRQDDHQLRGQHQKLVHSTGSHISNYKHIVEGVFLAPSHQSIGIQLADLVAGSVWRAFEKSDERWLELIKPILRKGPAGRTDGFGIVRAPKANWK